MDHTQIALIQGSFAKVAPISDQAAARDAASAEEATR